jgi:hypothetical protein
MVGAETCSEWRKIKRGSDVLKLCCDWRNHKEPIVQINLLMYFLSPLTDFDKVSHKIFLLYHSVTWWSVTMNGFWTDDWIYCTLCYSMWVHCTIHTHTSVQSHVFTAVAWQWLTMAGIPFPLGFWTVPSPSYQLLTVAAHYDWTPRNVQLVLGTTSQHCLCIKCGNMLVCGAIT